MNRILWLAAFLAFTGTAHAQTEVYQTAKGTGTVVNVLINTTAVNVDSSTRTLSGRFTIELWNDDATNSLHCAMTAGVSATSTDVNYGRRLSPRSSLVWAIPDSMKVWCVSDGGSGGARLVATQLK